MRKLAWIVIGLTCWTSYTQGQTRSPERSKAERKYEHRKFDSSLFSENAEATRSNYLESLEKVYQLLSQVPEEMAGLGQVNSIQLRLQEDDSALSLLKGRMSQSDRTFNIRNLQMFNTLLDQLSKDEKSYARVLDGYDKKVDSVKKTIAGLHKDTLILHIF